MKTITTIAAAYMLALGVSCTDQKKENFQTDGSVSAYVKKFNSDDSVFVYRNTDGDATILYAGVNRNGVSFAKWKSKTFNATITTTVTDSTGYETQVTREFNTYAVLRNRLDKQFDFYNRQLDSLIPKIGKEELNRLAQKAAKNNKELLMREQRDKQLEEKGQQTIDSILGR